jgi:hypothetical protein
MLTMTPEQTEAIFTRAAFASDGPDGFRHMLVSGIYVAAIMDAVSAMKAIPAPDSCSGVERQLWEVAVNKSIEAALGLLKKEPNDGKEVA